MTKNSNVNKNNNIIYLDLGDYDLKPKTKKKPKKKKTDNKKKAVDELKEVLSEFDNLLEQAQENKIKIPEELGSLPSNIEDINTIKELKQLTNDIINRNQQIQILLEKGITETEAEPEFGIIPITNPNNGMQIQAPQALPFQAGVQAQLVAPNTADTQKINMLESQIQKLGELIVKQKDPETGKKITDEKKANIEKIRQQLEKEQEEIISELTPEQQAKVREKQKEIETEARKRPLPPTPERPLPVKPVPSIPVEPKPTGGTDFDKADPQKDPRDLPPMRAGFQLITPEDKRDANILGESFEAPIGLYDEWETIKGFIKRNQDIAEEDKREPNLVNISRANFNQFKKEQEAKLKTYKIFVKNLNPLQTKSIQGELSSATTINKEILVILQNDPKKVLQNIFTSKIGRNIKINVVAEDVAKQVKPSGEFKGNQLLERREGLEAIGILKEMKTNLNQSNTINVKPKNFTEYKKKQMKIILDILEQASIKNKSYDEALDNDTPEYVLNQYSSNRNRNERIKLITKIISQYRKITGSGTYNFSKPYEPRTLSPVSINPNKPIDVGDDAGEIDELKVEPIIETSGGTTGFGDI